MNIVARANSNVVLAPVYVQNFILAIKSVERVQVGALFDFKSLIYEIVSNFRHDRLHSYKWRANGLFAHDGGGT